MDQYPVPDIGEWMLVDTEDEEMNLDISVSSKCLPIKVVSTLFDALFLDGNVNKKIAQDLTNQDKVTDVITGGAIYGTEIQKPWFNANRPFASIAADVYGSIVDTSDRHVLDSIIAIGKMLPQELVRNQTLGNIIEYYVTLENKRNPGSFNFDNSFSCTETKAKFNEYVFSNNYFYYCVDIDKLFPLIPIANNNPNRSTFRKRLNRLGLTEFRLKFLNEEGEDAYPGTEPKFKLLENFFYPFTNLAGRERQRNQLKSDFYTHLIVGVGAGYIKSLRMDSTVNRKKFISTFAGLTNKGNLLDFVKWLHSNKTSFIVKKSIKTFIKEYYQTKAYQGTEYITSKVNGTLREFAAPGTKEIIEDCLNCRVKLIYNDRGTKVIDVSLEPREQFGVLND